MTYSPMLATLAAVGLMATVSAQTRPSIQVSTEGNLTFYNTPPGGVGVMGSSGYQALATSADLASVTTQLQTVLSSLADLNTQLTNTQAMVNTRCLPLNAPANGTMSTAPPQLLPGTSVTFSCNTGHLLVGTATLVCQTDGTWHSPVPTCSFAPMGSSSSVPGTSCRAIYRSRRALNLPVVSGTYWLQHTGAAFQVYCDMTTPAQDGESGWTLCGKYDRNGTASNRWLSNGFARSANGLSDMATIGGVSSTTQKWASIDCRPLIDSNSMWMMHAGTDDASSPPENNWANANQTNGMVRFTNIMSDVKVDSTNLFDTGNDDFGQCRIRQAGAISTYNRSWINLNRVEDAQVLAMCPYSATNSPNRIGGRCVSLSDGACLVGDGHSLCSYNRDGSRFSNAGNAGCSGSLADTIYWAWDDDNHYCSEALRLGTGCHDPNSGPQLPTFRYNMLFVY